MGTKESSESQREREEDREHVLIIDLEETLVSDGNPVEDAVKFLERVRSQFVTVLLSNHTEARIREILSMHLLFPYFDLVVSATDYDMKKPDPRIIGVIRALLHDRFGKDFPRENFWIVGDRPDKDVLLGRKAGIKTIRVRRGRYADMDAEFEEERADYEVSSLTEALEILTGSISPARKRRRKSRATTTDIGKKEEKHGREKRSSRRGRKKKE